MGSQWAIDIVLRPFGAVVFFVIVKAVGKFILWPMRDGPLKQRLTARLSHGQAAVGLFLVTIITFLIVIVLMRAK